MSQIIFECTLEQGESVQCTMGPLVVSLFSLRAWPYIVALPAPNNNVTAHTNRLIALHARYRNMDAFANAKLGSSSPSGHTLFPCPLQLESINGLS